MEIGYPIVGIGSDKGKEFDIVDVNLFYESKCIKHIFLALRTLQQNNVAKRKNRVQQEMALVMLHMHNTPI